MEDIVFIVIEGIHKDPNNIDSIENNSKKTHGPFYDFKEANNIAKSLIQKNVDNFYHRAWVVKKNIEIDYICEECKKEDLSVRHNLIVHSYKICSSCNLSKTLFPV